MQEIHPVCMCEGQTLKLQNSEIGCVYILDVSRMSCFVHPFVRVLTFNEQNMIYEVLHDERSGIPKRTDRFRFDSTVKMAR